MAGTATARRSGGSARRDAQLVRPHAVDLHVHAETAGFGQPVVPLESFFADAEVLDHVLALGDDPGDVLPAIRLPAARVLADHVEADAMAGGKRLGQHS